MPTAPLLLGPLPPAIPDPLLMPMGKYYPSNYKSPANTSLNNPNSSAATPQAPMPPTLSIPTTILKRGSKHQPGHERKSSDMKRKLQQYQRDMIAQTRTASAAASGVPMAYFDEPIPPKLQPAGSPGPITPFELEESSGYIVAGRQAERVRKASLASNGLERQR